MNDQRLLFRRRAVLRIAWLGLFWRVLSVWPTSAAAQSSALIPYTFTTFAGVAINGSADGAGSDAQFSFPFGVAVDRAGNVYVADTFNDTIRKVTPAGVVTTLAGLAGASGSNDGTGIAARFSAPYGVAVDSASNVYVADTTNNTIRKVTPAGVVTTLAGLAGTSGTNDGTGTAARFNRPFGVAVDGATNVYVADRGNETIRKMTPVAGTTNWVVSTLAGLAGNYGSSDGVGTNALFDYPCGLAVDNGGNVYVADNGNETIRKITSAGLVTTIAGLAGYYGISDGAGTNALFNDPTGVAVASADNLYVADQGNNTIREVTPTGPSWVVTTVAGQVGHAQDTDGTGTNASFYDPSGVAVDSAGNVYVADSANCLIREINPAGLVTTLAGSGTSYGSEDGTGTEARFFYPGEIAAGPNGDFYVADTYNQTIRKISSAGVVSTLAGLAENYGQSDGVGSEARFYFPEGLTVDGAGNVYVADTTNNAIRKVTSEGVVTTIAGSPLFDENSNPVGGSANGTNSNAEFNSPTGVALDSAGNLYVADSGNNTIWEMTPVLGTTNWVVTTIAGLAGFSGAADGTNSAARFNCPYDLAVDGATNIYVVDQFNCTIRKISPVTGTSKWVVSTIAGSAGVSGSRDGMGTNALFGVVGGNLGPEGVAVDGATNLYVADTANSTIRKIVPVGTNWMVSTIAGSATDTGSANGAGSAAHFEFPQGVAVDSAGNVYVADTDNNTIRKGVLSVSGAANPLPLNAATNNATLVVTLLPPVGQWRFPWELAWRNSGLAATNLAAGNYPVQFSTPPGYLPIPSVVTTYVAAASVTYLTNQYYPTISSVATNSGGSLTVYFQVNPPGGAGWRLLGDTHAFLPAGFTTNLLPATYLIEFAPVSNFTGIPILSVPISAGTPTVVQEIYQPSQAPPGGMLLPTPVPANEIADTTNYPYGCNGQLETDVGYGSGVAVTTNVVLTAAHLIFNDQTLSYSSAAWWYFQEEAGLFQAEPQAAQGWLVLSGYAAQRTNDLQSGLYTPDESSPQSRNFDVAALYFQSPVANGGYGGYLPCDTTPNSWLVSATEKMLVGYPVDGSMFQVPSIVPGQMYEVGPQPYPLSLATDPVADQQVYTASWFLSYPGNSGGPFYVEFDGSYYPAGVYLGTLFNGTAPYASAVRAIDSNVVNLITNAQALVSSGTNNSGGGVITIIPSQGVNANNPGYVQFLLEPRAAVTAGAGWRLQGDGSYSTATNYTRAVTTTNAVVVQFKPIAGWNLPTNQTASVLPNQLITTVAFYTVSNPVLVASAALGLGITGTTGTAYQIQSRTNLSSGAWTPVSTNTITSSGFNPVSPPPTNHQPATFYRAVWVP